jgi:RNA-directed DNA polymerase
MTQLARIMKINNDIYPQIYNKKNLILAYKKARKGKTQKNYVIEFEKHLGKNLISIHEELKNQTYQPLPMKTFILRDPKTRKISKSSFRDRIVHHAICNILEPIFDKIFIYDSCANRKNKGTLFALKRFDKFQRQVTNNLTSEAFCFKADIKHYFQEINHKTLLDIIQRRIKDEKTINLIQKILLNNTDFNRENERASFLVLAKLGG